MATLNIGILNVPFLFYEDSFIYIHNIIKPTFSQAVSIITRKVRVFHQSGSEREN